MICGNCGHEMGESVYRGTTLRNTFCQVCGYGTAGAHGEQAHFARCLERVEAMSRATVALMTDPDVAMAVNEQSKSMGKTVSDLLVEVAAQHIDALDAWAQGGAR